MIRLVWRPLALADRDAIMDYIAEDSPAAALALDDDFEAKAEQARQHLHLYKTGRVPGTREVVVLPNYVMAYRIHGDELTILRVLHARQQWPAQR